MIDRGCCSNCGEGYDNDEEWFYNTECELCGEPIPDHLINRKNMTVFVIITIKDGEKIIKDRCYKQSDVANKKCEKLIEAAKELEVTNFHAYVQPIELVD